MPQSQTPLSPQNFSVKSVEFIVVQDETSSVLKAWIDPATGDGMAVLPQYILVCLFYNFHVWADLNYHERLDLTPLPSSLLASFNFRSTTSLQAFEQQHFRYVPRSLGHVLQHAKTRELHLRFSTGRWDDESWGARPWQGTKEGGTGVELWAWVDADNEEEY